MYFGLLISKMIFILLYDILFDSYWPKTGEFNFALSLFFHTEIRLTCSVSSLCNNTFWFQISNLLFSHWNESHFFDRKLAKYQQNIELFFFCFLLFRIRNTLMHSDKNDLYRPNDGKNYSLNSVMSDKWILMKTADNVYFHKAWLISRCDQLLLKTSSNTLIISVCAQYSTQSKLKYILNNTNLVTIFSNFKT